MARKQYGTTWWGKKWLDSLEGIDLANRIPRGLTYARTDKVFDVKADVTTGRITACVVGRFHPYYKVTLAFDRVSAKARDHFIDALISDLAVISRLSNRELDPRIFKIAQENGIKLFPTSWHDIGMKCNCPDYAIPCKHIAAVIYVVSELIDTNPFILFDLIGVNLKDELEKRGIFNDDATGVETPDMDALYIKALCLPGDIVKIAKKLDFNLNLLAVSPMDAASLFFSDDIITYSEDVVVLDEKLNNDLKSVDYQEVKLNATKKEIDEARERAANLNAAISVKKQDIQDLEISLSGSKKSGRGRPSAKALAMTERLSELNLELEDAQKSFTREQLLIESNKHKLETLVSEIAAHVQSCKSRLQEYNQHTAEVLRLGYDPSLLDEAEAALYREDRIEPALPSDATKEAPNAKESASSNEDYISFGDEEGDSLADAEAQKADEQILKELPDYVRRYQGSISSLAMLTFTEIPEIGDSLLSMYNNDAKGFTQGSLKSWISAALECASDLAFKQLKDVREREVLIFDEHRFNLDMQNALDIATNGTKDDFAALFGKNPLYSEFIPAPEKDSASGDEDKPKRGRKKTNRFTKTELNKLTRLIEKSSQSVQDMYANQGIVAANPFSAQPIAKHGFFARHPLFCLNNTGLLEIVSPILVKTTTKSGTILSNVAVMPEDLDVEKIRSLIHCPQLGDLDFDSVNATGLYNLFSGYIQNENMLSSKGSEIHILYYLWFIATTLVKKRAIMPQLYLSDRNDMYCRWVPASCSEEIATLVTKVGLALQGYEHFLYNRLDRRYYLDPKFLGETVLSAFIQSYVTFAYELDKKLPKDIIDLNFIFGHESIDIRSHEIAESSLRLRLETYLSAVSTDKLQYTPVLRFVDLSNYNNYGGTIFGKLENEIAQAANESHEKTIARLQAYADKTGDASLIEEYEQSFEDDDTYYEDDDMDYGSSSLADRGIGMELGFIGFSKEKLMDPDYEDLIDETGFVSLHTIITNSQFESMRQECLRTLTRLSSLAPCLDELFSSKYNVAIVPIEDVFSTISQARSTLKLLGVKLVLPKALQKFVLPSSTMVMDMDDDSVFVARPSFLNLAETVSFDWRLSIGDQVISQDQFKMLLANAGQIVRFNNEFVYADPVILNALENQTYRSMNDMSRAQALEALLTGEHDGSTVVCSDRLKENLRKLLEDQDVSAPVGLNATLRPYQQRGYEWMMRNARIQVGSIIADDMGLGKTVQVITTLLKLKEEGNISKERPALVIVPTSLITNWTREIAQFAPDLSVSAYYGAARGKFFGESDVILTSYGTARSRIKKLNEHEYSALVIDEAQAIKNFTAQISKAVRTIKADTFIAMSGTPVENSLMEYYSILDFVNRGLFGSTTDFKNNFASPIEKDRNQHAVDRFKKLTAPFIMRRLKSDKAIISDLPEKMTSDQYCELTPTQAALYQAVLDEKMKILESNKLDQNTRNHTILALIANLKAVCNSPAQFAKEDDTVNPEDSGKVERLYELLDNIMESNGKVLVFTQSVRMGKILQNLIGARFNHTPQFLYGGLSQKERMEIVDKFQNDSSERILLLSLRAAGVGLNLTAANFVIHYDLWWNPAVESQATDRAYRIGQNRTVQVYRFICANTFEERINEMINSKRDLADMTVAAGEKWIGSMSNADLNALFSLNTEK